MSKPYAMTNQHWSSNLSNTKINGITGNSEESNQIYLQTLYKYSHKTVFRSHDVNDPTARFNNRPTTSAYEVHIYLSVHMTFRDCIDANKDAKLIHGFLVVKLKSLLRTFNGCNHYFVMGVYIVIF
jgi:hypothetical protein